ncbi:MAG: hypothetical protein NC084_13595 [Bacteroides sp.]|nr:hypothetical protein [Eubacterium sp.]MCM1419727.1 hypothetical protein [Roseburia sp.]MCM1463730.1 hypothetical protein [Bacteroides sp.]
MIFLTFSAYPVSEHRLCRVGRGFRPAASLGEVRRRSRGEAVRAAFCGSPRGACPKL